MHLKIRDEKWAYPIEKAIGPTITQYVVDNTQDDKVSIFFSSKRKRVFKLLYTKKRFIFPASSKSFYLVIQIIDCSTFWS